MRGTLILIAQTLVKTFEHERQGGLANANTIPEHHQCVSKALFYKELHGLSVPHLSICRRQKNQTFLSSGHYKDKCMKSCKCLCKKAPLCNHDKLVKAIL